MYYNNKHIYWDYYNYCIYERCELVTHNLDTVPSQSRIKTNPNVDYFSRINAQCKYYSNNLQMSVLNTLLIQFQFIRLLPT